ncbi:thioesterase II family protein [Ectopseudomonas khazarica]|uniref:Medium-chain acyl-[acyl-carrier-protein] hydrolase n=1 Tax=Ectopseudomonas oleovorans TaxID=301 RepID=A0A653AYK3_ECTOL|nr:Medium-chain acyl-[acyl-carrier-protein] hydrolase [Pseudomonas oleovorans]
MHANVLSSQPASLSPWLQTRPLTNARLRLFCFPFAGGSVASFMPWFTALAPDIQLCAIQLPGRGARFGEPPVHDFATLIEQLGTVIASQGDRPYAFFGHSLGALVAFELAHHCVRRGLPQPRHLFVSASGAPRHRVATPRYDLMSDAELLIKLRDYAGTPPEVLANQELMALLLPVIRADFALLGHYRYQPRPRLDIPMSVLAGRADAHVGLETLRDWQTETKAGCQLHRFEGGHFFAFEQADAVLELVKRKLATVL